MTDPSLAALVRAAHVLAATLVVGGAAALTLAPLDPPARARLATRYEVLFWIAASAVVATGIGNVGALGIAPPTGTRWGTVFAWKMTLVTALLVASAFRSALVLRPKVAAAPRADIVLRSAYAATAGVAGATTLLGVLLAHGG